jgi:hypothetical protein
MRIRLLLTAGAILGAATASKAEEFQTGDKVEVRVGKEVSRAEVVFTARESNRLLVRLDSIVGGRSGPSLLFRDAKNGVYLTENGQKASVTRWKARKPEESPQ